MKPSSTSTIKRAQKGALYLKIISQLFNRTAQDDASLREFQITNVELSPDKGVIYVLFYCDKGQEYFEAEGLKRLILYKPSLRAALAREVNGRYTPEIVFKYDKLFEKAERINSLIDKLKEEDEQQIEE